MNICNECEKKCKDSKKVICVNFSFDLEIIKINEDVSNYVLAEHNKEN